MSETMMPKDLATFIETKEMFVKLDKLELMENSAINAVLSHLEDGHLDEELVSLIKLNRNFYRFLYSTVINTIYFNSKECHIQVNFVIDYEKLAKFKDEHKSTFINPFYFSPLNPLPNKVVVEVTKINPAPLSEADRKTILKKLKEEEKRQTLKRKLSEINDHQSKVKKAAELYKKKSKSSERQTVFRKEIICIFFI